LVYKSIDYVTICNPVFKIVSFGVTLVFLASAGAGHGRGFLRGPADDWLLYAGGGKEAQEFL